MNRKFPNAGPRDLETGGVVWTKRVHGSQADDAGHVEDAHVPRVFQEWLVYPVMDGDASQSYYWAHCPGRRHSCPQQFGMRTWMRL